MYKIVFPIPVLCHDDSTISLPIGLARDIIAHLKYEPKIRIICPSLAGHNAPPGYMRIQAEAHPGLSWRLLPWAGGKRQFWLSRSKISKILKEEARDCTVWHSACSTNLFDVTTLGYHIGRRFAPCLKVLALDSDPAAMLEKSRNVWATLLSGSVARRYARWAAQADATIMMGAGVVDRYARHAKCVIRTNAVWLTSDDLATQSQVESKFETMDPVRMIVASRLLPWKGVDDVISALQFAGDRLGKWQLDIVGEGPEIGRLKKLASLVGERINFKPVVPYGNEFFSLLRQYHVAIIPTRATEEARIAYDSLASGCVLVSSRTSALEACLDNVSIRFSFLPGNVPSLVEALQSAMTCKSKWKEAAQLGLVAMKGRTIDEMHRIRAEALSGFKLEARYET